MKLVVAPLLLLLVLLTVSAMDSRSVKRRVKDQLHIWVAVQEHCAEASFTDGSIDMEKALECKKCHASVGDWFTDEGSVRGKECLEKYEPQTVEMCGALFQEWKDNGYDTSISAKWDECWQDTYIRDIAAKCLEVTGEGDKNLAFLCVIQHLTKNHQHAENVIFGSSDDTDPYNPSKMQMVVESVFDEGRCIHANEGNNARIQECTMCFNHVLMKEKKLFEKMHLQKKYDVGGLDEGDYFKMGKKVGTMWAFCADSYLAPAYSECTEDIEELVHADPEDWLTEEWKAKQNEIEGCMLLKQSQHYYKMCSEAGGEGLDGFMNFYNCAQNGTLAWVMEKRPDAVDMVAAYMKGGMLPVDAEEL